MKYNLITEYIDIFQPEYLIKIENFGENVAETVDEPNLLSCGIFETKVADFKEAFCESNIAIENYEEVIENAGINADLFDFVNMHILNETVVCAILTYIIRKDRFCEGYLKAMISRGTVIRVLMRLRDIDEYNPYPHFHVKFVKGKKIAEVQTVMLKDMGFPYDLAEKDTKYEFLDEKQITELENEFIYLIENLLPRNIQDLFYRVGLEPCQAYWEIYDGAVKRLQIPRCEDYNNNDYGKFIGFVEAGIKDLFKKGYTLNEIYESTCVTKTMILENCSSDIDRILFRNKECRYIYGFLIDGIFYDYAVARDNEIILLIKLPDYENFEIEESKSKIGNYAGNMMIPVMVINSWELWHSDSLGKEINMALREPGYVVIHNERENAD